MINNLNLNYITNHKEILEKLLTACINPAFGTLPKAEIDLLILEALIDLKVISQNPNSYDLISKLRVTNTKAKKLIYERELRRKTTEQLDEEVKKILTNPIIQKEKDLLLFKIDNPLVIDHIKFRIRDLGYLTDGSFSSNIIKLSTKAFREIVISYMSEDIKIIEKKLSEIGIESKNFRGFFNTLLTKVGKRIGNDIGEELATDLSKYITPLFSEIKENTFNHIKELFKQ